MNKSLNAWMEEMEEKVEGKVFISCVMDKVPGHDNTKRYQVYNEEGTYNKTFDITLDEDKNIISIE